MDQIKKFFSRKLFAFAVATSLLCFGKIDEGTWVVVTGIYIGSQGIIDGLQFYFQKKNGIL